jgi:hypothetical protein
MKYFIHRKYSWMEEEWAVVIYAHVLANDINVLCFLMEAGPEQNLFHTTLHTVLRFAAIILSE